tara:strand:+ start:1354 stop:2394 length:1041 start_codon:yes stop_codon:yes gene_type:complete
LEQFKSFITEKEHPYKLLILSHDDPLDPNETGPMIRKKASELGLNVYLAEFSGMYMESDGDNKLVYSFPVDENGKVELPTMKSDAKYDKPFKINPNDTLIMARGLGSSVNTGNRSWYIAIKTLEADGYTIFNSTKCHDICNDKWYNQVIFQQNNFNTPTTVLIRHSEGAEIAAKKLGNKFPMILKTSIGSRGVGVMLVESLKSLHSIVQLLHRENEFVDVILQEWIKTEYDVRVIVASGQIIGAIKRPIVNDDFRSNVSQGSEPTEHELTDLEISESLRAAKAVDGMIVGVDFIPSKNRDKEVPIMIEVNSTPGLIGIEEALKDNKKSITTEILKIFMNRDNWRMK